MSCEVVSIDLGSNSFRVLKYDCKNHKILAEYNEVVGLADGLIESGDISSQAQERVVKAIQKSQEKISYDTKKAIAVTTAAARKAKNSKEVLDFIKEQTGVKFSIIDGQEEARLTLLAVKYALKREKIFSQKFILLDIGGGSTELIVNIDEEYIAKSFDFGIVTLTQKYKNLERVQKDLEEKQKVIKAFLDTLNINLNEYIFVSTAGTPTTIAAMKLGQDFFSYDKNIVNGTSVDLEDLQKCLNIFKNSSKEQILKLVGKGRVEFIEVGILIYRSIFQVLQKNTSIVVDDGLREGVAINACLR